MLNNLDRIDHDAVGLYRATLKDEESDLGEKGKRMYIGSGVKIKHGSNKGQYGLLGRLSQHVKGNSGANCKMYRYKEKLSIEILVTGKDTAAVSAALFLEAYFIFAEQPEWNVKE